MVRLTPDISLSIFLAPALAIATTRSCHVLSILTTAPALSLPKIYSISLIAAPLDGNPNSQLLPHSSKITYHLIWYCAGHTNFSIESEQPDQVKFFC